jgi:cyclic pyranopterin phosphate synthase
MNLTHLDKEGRAHMVDVSHKEETLRRAVAEAQVHMKPETLKLLLAGNLPKGEALPVARLAGIMGAKKTSDLIPLCHPLRLKQVSVDFSTPEDSLLSVRAEVVAVDSTGVEMEALTAASIAALTVIDMCKAVDKRMVIRNVRLLSKSGGQSGDFSWEGEDYHER